LCINTHTINRLNAVIEASGILLSYCLIGALNPHHYWVFGKTARNARSVLLSYLLITNFGGCAMPLESYIERKFVEYIRSAGGMALKIDASSCAGIPDRLVVLPDGKMFFVELKQPGKKPRPLQLKRHADLRKLGFEVYVIDSVDAMRL
jgi:hypothetical protein